MAPKEIRRHRKAVDDALDSLKGKGVFAADTCGDLTGYPCNWVITDARKFAKHLKDVHPEGEER